MARILLAEDDPHILRVVSLWLRRNGHEVTEVRSGTDALERLRADAAFDLMVTDMNMPGMTGLEVLRAARAEGRLPRGAVVLTSRCDQREIAEAAAAVGGVVHPKPFSPSRLLATIAERLEGSAALSAAPGLT